MTIRDELIALREELNDAAMRALEMLETVIEQLPEEDPEEVPDGA